jgi:hypothetical protein
LKIYGIDKWKLGSDRYGVWRKWIESLVKKAERSATVGDLRQQRDFGEGKRKIFGDDDERV